MDRSKIAAWLKDALAGSGISQTKLASELSISLNRSVDKFAVSKMTLGKREVLADEMIEIARITGQPAPFTQTSAKTPVVGYVGTGAVYAPFEIGIVDEVDRPPWANERTVAAEIRGDSLGSMFDRWLVYYDDVQEQPTTKMIGKLCIVWLTDRRVVVKKLTRGQISGLFTLLSNFDPPIYDVAIDGCALVKNMAPR